METEFGSAIVHFGESAEGYLICHAENQYGQSVWAASHSSSTAYTVALSHGIMQDASFMGLVNSEYGLSIHSEEAAIHHLQRVENNARMARNEADGLCQVRGVL